MPFKAPNTLVLGIPRGGVEVAYEVARQLDAPLSIVIVRKLPIPSNPEAGFGAVAEDGSAFFIDRICNQIPGATRADIVQQQQQEVQRRIEALRNGRPLPDLGGRNVILVDDGVAMGSTMRAALALCRHQQAQRVVVAVPVAGPAVARQLAEAADALVVLKKPPGFRAVAEVYRDWYDVPDDEVIRILQKADARERAHN